LVVLIAVYSKQNALPCGPTDFGRLLADHSYSNDLKLINLKSVLIGNGWTHPEIQYSSYLPTACDRATGYGPYLDEATCTTMRESLPRCQQLMRDCAANATDAQLCQSGKEYCEKTQTDPFYATVRNLAIAPPSTRFELSPQGRNAFDMEKRGDYPEDHWVEIFLN
jgi:cathepsin A (carboxypeptidase C)